jgi:hypothetical protein
MKTRTVTFLGFIPDHKIDGGSNSKLNGLKNKIQTVTDSNNELVHYVWALKLQAQKTKDPMAKKKIEEKITILQTSLSEIEVDVNVERANEEVNEMENSLCTDNCQLGQQCR